MKKSPLSTPNYHTGNFRGRYRGRSRGYNYHRSRNDSNHQFHWSSGSDNFSNNQPNNVQSPSNSSPQSFYRSRGYQRPMFDVRNQGYSGSSMSHTNDNQNDSQNQSNSPYQRKPNLFLENTEIHWYRTMPINEFIDLKKIFEDPWAELDKQVIINLSNSTIGSEDETNNSEDPSISEENSLDINNRCDEQKAVSSAQLQEDFISSTQDSENEIS